MKPIEELCPCGTGRLYGRCCGVWHTGLPAPNAEQLMRARYSAFVMSNERFLLDSWHPSKRPARIDFAEGQTWLGLTVVKSLETGANSAEVEFIARSRIGRSKPIRQYELSRFIREGGYWFYVDGLLK